MFLKIQQQYILTFPLSNEFSACRRARIGLIFTQPSRNLNSKMQLIWNSKSTYSIWSTISWEKLLNICEFNLPCRCERLWSERRRRCSQSGRCLKLSRSGSSSRMRWRFNTTISRNRVLSFSSASPRTR